MEPVEHRKAIGRRFGMRIANGDAVFLSGAGRIGGLPCTITNGQRRQLGGMNRFMLLQVMKDQGWTDPRFFTADQVKQEGWSIAPGAKQVGLQFLVANGADGFPLEIPETKLFHVFNAGEIAGVPVAAPEPVAPSAHLEQAAMEAGFAVGQAGLRASVTDWLTSLQAEQLRADPAGLALRVHLAAALLEVQTALPAQEAALGEYALAWARTIETNPLSLFQAVKDAEEMAATVMAQVKSLEIARQVENEIDSDRAAAQAQKTAVGEVKMEEDKSDASARMQALFEQRTAVLAVPFADKDRAKAAGAMWYSPEAVWFVPGGLTLDRFREWNPSKHFLGLEATTDKLIEDFRDKMIECGLVPPDQMPKAGPIIADGKWHNVSVTTTAKKNLSGGYLLTLGDEPKGVIRNMHTGMTTPWTYQGPLLTPEQRAKLRVKANRLNAQKAEQEAKAQEDAAIHAGEIIAQAHPATENGYVLKKGISPEGLYEAQGEVLLQYPEFFGESGETAIHPQNYYLVIPMCNAAGEIRAVQAISEDGALKCFMRGAQKQGTMLVLGGTSFDDVCAKRSTAAIAYVEGLATGRSFQTAAGTPTVVCWDAGNLKTVIADTAAKVPGHVLPIVAVDNDQFFIERAMDFISRHIGTNPHAPHGVTVHVGTSASAVRPVSLGDVVPDGEWHQARGGKYCVTLAQDQITEAVQSITVELVPIELDRKVQAKFTNTGIEAGKAAMEAFSVEGGKSRAVMPIPEFVSLKDRPTDWNDLHHREGIEGVRTVLRAVEGIAARAQQQAQQQRPIQGHSRASAGMSR